MMGFRPGASFSPISTTAGAITAIFMTVLFFMMMRTHNTYRWRRIFFVSLGSPLSHWLYS